MILIKINTKNKDNYRININIPPAGEGTPSKKSSLHEGSEFELTLNRASLRVTQTT